MRRWYSLVLAMSVCLLTACQSNLKDGTVYLEDKQYEKAIVCFEEEIADEKNQKEAYRGIGIARYELGEYEAAITAFESALSHGAKETANLYHLMAESYYGLQQYDKALEFYGKVLSMEDCTDELRQGVRFNEIAIYLEQSNWELAKEKVAAYVTDYPEDSRMDKTAEFLETR